MTTWGNCTPESGTSWPSGDCTQPVGTAWADCADSYNTIWGGQCQVSGLKDMLFVETLADLKAICPSDYTLPLAVETLGRLAVNDGGGGVWLFDPAGIDPEDTTWVVIPTSAGCGPGQWNRVWNQRDVYAAWTPAVGDDVAEDGDALRTLFDKAEGINIHLENGKTYRVSGDLVLQDYCKCYMNGAKLNVFTDGPQRGFDMYNHTGVYGGTIEATGTNIPLEGWYCGPITICGDEYGVGLDGVTDVEVDNMTLITNRPGGQAIQVGNRSNNVRLTRLTFPSSAELGRCILIHWGFAGGAPEIGGTSHPYNVFIDGVECGDQPKLSARQAVVFTSGAYNVTVTNCNAGECDNYSLFEVYCGDYGFQYAPEWQKRLNGTGLTFSNSTIKKSSYGVKVDTRIVFGDDAGVMEPSNCKFSNLGCHGLSTNIGIGAWIPFGKNVTIEDCVFTKYGLGSRYSTYAEKIDMVRCHIKENYTIGWESLQGANNFVQDIKFEGCIFENNNTAQVENYADLWIRFGRQILVKDCIFISPNNRYQLRVQAFTYDDTLGEIRIIGNTFRDIWPDPENKAIPIITGDYNTKCIIEQHGNQFLGNTEWTSTETAILPAVYGTPSHAGPNVTDPPGDPQGVIVGKKGTRKIFWSDIEPINPEHGPNYQGDICYNSNVGPGAGETIYWICVADGSPGTWEAVTK